MAKKPESINLKELEAVEDVLHGSPINEARHDISELKEKVIEHTEDLIEVNSIADDYAESKVSRRLRARVNHMIAGVDSVVAKLESQRRQLRDQSKAGMGAEDMLPEETPKKPA